MNSSVRVLKPLKDTPMLNEVAMYSKIRRDTLIAYLTEDLSPVESNLVSSTLIDHYMRLGKNRCNAAECVVNITALLKSEV